MTETIPNPEKLATDDFDYSEHAHELDSGRRRHNQRNHGGPHGLGDPCDRTLRHVESEKIIPKIIRDEINQKCKSSLQLLYDCVKKEGQIAFLTKCTEPRDLLNECYESWLQKPEFYEEVTEKYLEERALYRATGLNKKERRIQAFREWKRLQASDDQKKS